MKTLSMKPDSEDSSKQMRLNRKINAGKPQTAFGK